MTQTYLTNNAKNVPPPNPGKSDVMRSTGNAVVQFANQENGKTVTYNVSGATTETVSIAANGDKILTANYTGPSFVAMGPNGRTNTGQPGIVYSPGHTVVTVDLSLTPPTVLSYSTKAPITDVCAAIT